MKKTFFIVMLLSLSYIMTVTAQTVTYNGCAENDIPQNLVLAKDPTGTTDAGTPRSTYFASIMPSGQPGYLVVAWSTVRHRWEIFFNIDMELNPDASAIALYYHSSTAAPSPPQTGWTIEGAGGCITPATLSGEVLPVQLLWFIAHQQRNNILLQWSTAREVNFSHFEVERSYSRNDFVKISIVRPTSTLTTTYTSADALSSTAAFYRLKMVDIDGAYHYSPVVAIRPSNATSTAIFPNPATSALQVLVPAIRKGILTLQVLNYSGQVVFSKTYGNDGNALVIPLSLTGLSKGHYLLQILQDGFRKSSGFVKQ